MIKSVLLTLILMGLAVSKVYAGNTDSIGSPCLTELKRTCRVITDHGTYYVPDGWRQPTSKQALLVDLGGPGVLPGSLERFDYSVFPAEMIKDKLIILLAARWGTQNPNKACLDGLEKHVKYTRGTIESKTYMKEVNANCGLQEAASNYANRSAALVEIALDDWGIDSYQVVGASYAATRWQGILGSIDPERRPDNITIVSPLIADTRLSEIVAWQAERVNDIWETACARLKEPDAVNKCISITSHLATGENISGLMMLAWSPTAADEFVGYLEHGIDQLEAEVKKLSDRYYFLNAVDYPRSELFEYVVGVCSSIIVDDIGLTKETQTSTIARQVYDMLGKFYSICSELNQSYSSLASVTENVPTCYVELAKERVTPPLSKSTGKFKSIIYVSERPYFHGDMRVLEQVGDVAVCGLHNHSESVKTVELTPGLLDLAMQRIGLENVFLPVLADNFEAEFHLANIMIRTEQNDSAEFLATTDVDTATDESVTGYCVSGWLIPDNGGKGRSYNLAIGLDQNAPPTCDIQTDLVRSNVSAGQLSIAEAFSCKEQHKCRIRSEIDGLTNGVTFVQLM